MPAGECVYYPLGLRLSGEKVVVLGGGAVAERKVAKLLECGARVHVVSPRLTPGLTSLAESGAISREARLAAEHDVNGALLVFVATDDEEANTRLANAAHEAGALVNRADKASECDFIVPASFARGNLRVAVFSDATSPVLARWLRRRLEALLDEELGQISLLVGQIRAEVRQLPLQQSQRAALLNSILESDVLDLLKTRGFDAALRRARQIMQSPEKGSL